MIVKYIELALLIGAAVISDVKTYKIKNVIILLFVASGIVTCIVQEGLSGLIDSMIAALLPVPLLIIFFALKMLGAGDIKLFCAIGAIGGIEFVLYSMAYSFISGGIIAIIMMFLNKSFRERGRYLLTYIKTCFLTRSLQPYSNFLNKADSATFRFSYAAACGVLIEAVKQIFF